MSKFRLRSGIALFALASFVVAAPLAAQSMRFMPQNDPVYGFLERAKVDRWVTSIPEVRPYTEKQVLAWLKEISGKSTDGTIQLRDVDKKYVDDEIVLLSGGKTHAAEADASEIKVMADFGIKNYDYIPLNRIGDSFPHLGLQAGLSMAVGDTVYMSLMTEWFGELAAWNTAPFPVLETPLENDNNVVVLNPDAIPLQFPHDYHDPGEVQVGLGVNGVNQFSLDLGLAQISLSNFPLDWGPGMQSRLLLSSTAKSYENMWFSIPIGDIGNFSWMMGFLQEIFPLRSDETGKKHVSAHRIEISPVSGFGFALSESVIYSDRFELAYLVPLGLYFVDETKGGDYDNKNVGAEFYVSGDHVRGYLSAFLDDWNLLYPLSPTAFRNTFGALLGVQTNDLFVPGLGIDMEIAHMSHWLYTHKTDFLNPADRYNSYTNFGASLGGTMEPNSFGISLKGEYSLDPTVNAGLLLFGYWHGPGNIYTPYDATAEAAHAGVSNPDDIIYSFLDIGDPTAILETIFDAKLYGSIAIPSLGLLLDVSYTLEIYNNKGNVLGTDGVDNILTIEFQIGGNQNS